MYVHISYTQLLVYLYMLKLKYLFWPSSGNFIHSYFLVPSFPCAENLRNLQRDLSSPCRCTCTCVHIKIITSIVTALVSCHADILEQDSKQTYLFWLVVVSSTNAHSSPSTCSYYNVLPSPCVEPEAPTNTSSRL